MKRTLICFLSGICTFYNTWGQSGLSGPIVSADPSLVQQRVALKDTRPVRRSPQPTVADKAQVMDYFQNQEFEEAIDYLGPALGEDSASVPVLGYLGYAYYMSDKGKAAESCYQKILELDSVNKSALYYLEVLNYHEDPERALGFTLRLVKLQPGKAVWWRTKGELQRRLKQPDSALPSLCQAYELAPEDAKNIGALADILIEKKDYGQADSILDAGLAKDSLNFPLLKLRMRSAYNAKNYAAVLAPGERTMRLNLPDINAQSWLALSYYNLQRYPDCIRACEFLQSNGYDVESVLYYESRAKAKLRNYAESNDLLAICLKKAISHTAEWYYNDLGDNYEGLKDFKAAIASYDTAYYLFKDPTMLYNCGRLAESGLKNNVLARKYYLRYLTLAHPELPEEKKAYAYVKARWGRK
ncbi:MAG TPA: tetratricopeptide repeat protein [Puia sp.]|nr:tetratricopeptide repeat protein [Puia sp.]